jgi:hypothetical protein
MAMRLAWLAIALCVAHAPPTPPDRAARRPAPAKPDAGTKLDDLLGQFKRAPGLYARFKEEKHLAMLDRPLVTEGTIHFSPPQRFARRTESPMASTLVIDGADLQFGDADGRQSIDLGTNPVARLFVDSFVRLLAGDRAGLERIFKLELAPRPNGGGGWQLALVPRVTPMDKVIKEMTLRGEGLVLQELDLRETNGDWTHTTFTHVDLNRRYTSAEQDRIFHVRGP